MTMDKFKFTTGNAICFFFFFFKSLPSNLPFLDKLFRMWF